jgi:hypothetical protein
MRADIPFALKDSLESLKRPLAIWVNWSDAITPRRIPTPKRVSCSPSIVRVEVASRRATSRVAGRSVIE